MVKRGVFFLALLMILISVNSISSFATLNCLYGSDVIEVDRPDSLIVVDFGTPVNLEISDEKVEFNFYPDIEDFSLEEKKQLELVENINNSIFKFRPFDELVEQRRYSLYVQGYTIPKNDIERPVLLEQCQYFYVYYGPLRIEKVYPKIDYMSDALVPLEFRTNRKSTCRLSPSVENYDSMLINLPSSDQYLHSASYPSVSEFYIACQDVLNETISKKFMVVLDSTGPQNIAIDDSSDLEGYPERSNRLDFIRAKFSGLDPESGIEMINYTIASKATNEYILGWSTSSRIGEWILITGDNAGNSLILSDGSEYKVVAKFMNKAGIWSEQVESNGIQIDSWFDPDRVGPELFCSNEVIDVGETYLDCGGTCPGCDLGHECTLDNDCSSHFCSNETGICTEPSCDDGVLNGQESGIDCGGICNQTCSLDSPCNLDSDCDSNYCLQGKCSVPNCFDNTKNGDEPDVDCGGSCVSLCPAGRYCDSNFDCESGICDELSKRCEAVPEPEPGLDYTLILIVVGILVGLGIVGGLGYYLYKNNLLGSVIPRKSSSSNTFQSNSIGGTVGTSQKVQSASFAAQPQMQPSVGSQTSSQAVTQNNIPRSTGIPAGTAAKLKQDLQSKEKRRKVDSLFGEFGGASESSVSKKDINGLFGGLENKDPDKKLALDKSKEKKK